MVADTRIARPIVPSPRRRGGRDASSPREPLSLRGPDVTSAPRPGGTAARLAERGPVDATSARPGGAISTVSTALTRFSGASDERAAVSLGQCGSDTSSRAGNAAVRRAGDATRAAGENDLTRDRGAPRCRSIRSWPRGDAPWPDPAGRRGARAEPPESPPPGRLLASSGSRGTRRRQRLTPEQVPTHKS